MILNQLTYEKSKIEYYKQVKVSDYLKTIVSLYNEGLDDLNKFIKYRNKQFTHNFRQRIEGHDRWTKNKLRRCQEMLNNFDLLTQEIFQV
jgi:hypothetical protein